MRRAVAPLLFFPAALVAGASINFNLGKDHGGDDGDRQINVPFLNGLYNPNGGNAIEIVTDLYVSKRLFCKVLAILGFFSNLQNFVEAACSVVVVPCEACFVPLLNVCPQPLPALCWACSETQDQWFTRRRVAGVTEYLQRQNVSMSEFGFRSPEPFEDN